VRYASRGFALLADDMGARATAFGSDA